MRSLQETSEMVGHPLKFFNADGPNLSAISPALTAKLGLSVTYQTTDNGIELLGRCLKSFKHLGRLGAMKIIFSRACEPPNYLDGAALFTFNKKRRVVSSNQKIMPGVHGYASMLMSTRSFSHSIPPAYPVSEVGA